MEQNRLAGQGGCAGMLKLADHVAATIVSKQLFCRNQSILVAVSGGIDSMVLLHLLVSLGTRFGWKLTVAHFNHQLRGASSNADEEFVVRVARQLNLPVIVSKADVAATAAKAGVSTEMAGRQLRHQFLADTALTLNNPVIALAHHLDDQVELFFLRLLRGSGSFALGGMRWSNPSPANSNVRLVRPLLDCAKAGLREYASIQNISFREDSTNSSSDILRNRIRHELLPLLRRDYQPGLDRSVIRVMELLAAESDFIATTAEDALVNSDRAPNASTRVVSADFESLPVAIQRYCLHARLLRLGILPDYELIEHLRTHPGIPIEVGWAQVIPGHRSTSSPLRLVRQAAQVVACPPKDRRFIAGQARLGLKQSGHKSWHGVAIEWRIEATSGQKLPAKAAGVELFDADKLGRRVVVRHWQPGDRFQPIGMRQKVKLQDLFVNQKVAPGARRHLLVGVSQNGELFWVEGLRISERFKLTKRTIRRLHWRWQRL